MSTSLSPRSSGSSGHPTRQQLDELDALLQRMLALPVNQTDDASAEINDVPQAAPTLHLEPVSYRASESQVEAAPQSGSAPRLDDAHVSSATEGNDDAENWIPLSSTWKPSPHTWKPLAQSWQQPRSMPPAQETPPSHEEPVSDPSPTPTQPLESVALGSPAPTEATPLALRETPPAPPVRTQEEPPLPGWLRLLVWFNIAFDLLLLPWGMPGRWLRRDGEGRSVLGGVGILLLTVAVVLGVMEWFGWTWDDLLARIR